MRGAAVVGLAALLGLHGLPGLARCVTAGDLAKGVVFARDGGFSGRVVAREDGVFVDYAFGVSSVDERQTELGIYELGGVTGLGSDYVGSAPIVTQSQFRGTPPVPQAGADWASRVVIRVKGDGTTSETGDSVETLRRRVRYAFLAERKVTLSGCSYRAIPVEAVFQQGGDEYRQRWIFFPDLGFGLETIPLGSHRAHRLTRLQPE